VASASLRALVRGVAVASSLVSIAVSGATLLACEDKGGSRSPLPERKEEPSAEALGKWIDLWIPPGASGYRSHAESWQDWVVLATFELPAAELPAFLTRNQLIASAAVAPVPPSKQPWFQPPADARTYTPAPSASDAAKKPSRFAKVYWISQRDARARARVYLRATDS
jgi:hypothetical protein